jgi:hypothetical protein
MPSTYYVDYEGGNNANNGTTFLLRWKDLTNGATAARIAPGDTIRMMASPDPQSLGQTATWTDGPLPATVVPTSSTNATPIVFTKTGHGLVTGDTVIVNGHTTNTNANGVWDVTVSGDTFTLLNADGSNSVGNGTGGATGTVRKITNSVVKLTTPVTKNIACFGNNRDASNPGKPLWVKSANVNTTVSLTTYKEGYTCERLEIQTAFTTGLAGYLPTGTLDLSGYQQVSFWVEQIAGTLGAAGSCSLALCSDATGTAVVNTINIPALGALNRWSPITVDTGGNLGSSIQSIAFYVNTDNGAQTFYIDNVIACKASSSADSLSLTSLISKNTGTEGWFGIQSINGTRVILDQDSNCTPVATPSRGYSGTTETVTLYKRETIKTVMGAAPTTLIQEVMDSGTSSAPITYSSGWNRTDMSTQSGTTFFDGQNGYGYGISIASKSWVILNGPLVTVRYNNGFNINISNNLVITEASISNSTGYGLFVGTSPSYNFNITLANTHNNFGGGIQTYNLFKSIVNVVNADNNTGVGVRLDYSNTNKTTLDSAKNCSTATVAVDYGNYNMTNCSLNSNPKVSVTGAGVDTFLWSTNENSNTDTHFGYTDNGLISSDVTTVHTEGGMSWKLSPTSTNRSATYPLPLKVATGATPANTPITCNVWFRRDNTGLTARLICKGGQLTGMPSDVSSSMTAAANTWELLSVTVTPSQRGVLEFTTEAWGGTTYNAWVEFGSFS